MKKALFTFFAVLATYTCAFADTAGNCGDKCYWTYEEATQTLTITGEGEMWHNAWQLTSLGYIANTNIRDNIKHIIVGDKITSIDCFEEFRNLEDVQLPNSLKHIGRNTFDKCTSLKSIYIPESVEQIYPIAAGCSSLTEIIVDPNNKNYDSRYNCNAIIETKTNKLIEGCKATTIPNSVTSIGEAAFYLLPIEEIYIPEGITTIGNHAFQDCKQLKSITLPSTLTEIGYYAFDNCLALESIAVKATSAPDCLIEKDGTMTVFYSVDKDNCTVYVPQHRDSRSYLTAPGWKDFKNIVQVDMDEYEKSVAARKLCDTNQDGIVNAADIVRIYNFINDGK